MLIILCGNTAVGKDTYQNMLLDRNPNLHRAVSHTTRPMRIGEVDGKEYYFVNASHFMKMQMEDSFIETRVYSTIQNGKGTLWYYGLSYDEVKGDGAAIAIVDHQGTREILSKRGDIVVKVVYLTAPEKELKRRSISRNDEAAEFERRLKDDIREFMGVEEIADLIINTHTLEHEENLMMIEKLLEV